MASPGPQQLPPLRPGQQPTPEQIQAIQRQLAIDAQKHGMTVPQFVERLKQQAAAQRAAQAQAMARAQAQGQAPGQSPNPQQPRPQGPQGPQQVARPPQPQQQQGQPQPIAPGPPNPAAIALAKFLKGQDLKPRTCILNGQRKDMFRVKRALRAIQSPAYEKARKKNPLLPEITDRASLENCFKLLPLSLLALRVTKIEPQDKSKRVKGLWNVKIEQQQECREDLHYVWLYEGSQIKQKLYAAGALALVFTIVMFPLWPMKLRLGVWYLSMGMLGLIGLFFAMAIFRLILFVITMFAVPPGLWLFPNLFEDVGFFDSFKPVWGWQEDKKKKKKKTKGSANAGAAMAAMTGQPPPATATTTGVAPEINTSDLTARNLSPRVEEVLDDE